MRRHFLFAEDETERSVGEGKNNLLRLWHNRRNAMLDGDELATGGEANALVARELTLLWDLAKPMSSCTLKRDEYVRFFARAGKALVLQLTTDAIAIHAAQRDWEYDLEGVGSANDSAKAASSLDNEVMSAEQFREAVMQLAEIILPVESAPSVFATFFRDLRNSVAQVVPKQEETEPVDRFSLRPMNKIPKIATDAFLQKGPPSSEALRSIRGLQAPDLREMSLKQLLLCYNPRKFSLTRAFPQKKDSANGSATKVADEVKTDEITVAKGLHLELMGSIGSGATPVRGRKIHRESVAHWHPEDALTAALTEFPALRIAVVGPPGCGKTRLARVLAQRLGLKYLSLDKVIQSAVERKLRIRQGRSTVVAAADGDDSTVEIPEETLEADKLDTDNGEDEERDRVFRDEDFDALCAGGVVTRGTALDLFRLEVTRCALAGVGVIMDDVYPCELSISNDPKQSVAVDYLVALTALPNEVEYQLKDSEFAPAAGRLYSVRELAILKATNAEELAGAGFADFLSPPVKLESETEEVQEHNSGIENGDANASNKNQEDAETSPEENGQEGVGDDGQSLPEKLLPPPEPTPLERNEIEAPKEPTLPFGSMTLVHFTRRYHEYVTRMQRELVSHRSAEKRSSYQLLVVLATQSLHVIRDHCIQTITGTSLGLSRFSTSHEACPVPLAEDLNGSSRADKVKWLLYGDWATILEAEANSTIESFARLPRRDTKRRLLSRWREFCPAMSTSAGILTLGDPDFAACYSGRIYFFASQDARRAFCAYPLQFLRREIPGPSKCRNFWLVTTGTGDVITPSYLEALETGLHVQTVSTSKLLMTSPSIAMEMRLMSGQIVSPVEGAAVVSEAVKALMAKTDLSGWMITDLPLTREVAAALLEHGCVPDVILLMDREAGDGEGNYTDTINALSVLRNQQFQAEKAGSEDISQGIGGVARVIKCPLFRQPSDTLAAIERELNPLAPPIDKVEDGHAPELVDEYDPTVIFAPPLPEKDEDNDGKQPSALTEGATDPEEEAQAEAARNRALLLQGECGRFCPVTWHCRGLLIPGLPANVCSFRQKFYAFAGEQERHAFERNPAAFIPNGPLDTANFLPWVLVLGVRGSGCDQVAVALAQLQSEQVDSLVEYVNVDLAAVANSAERRRLFEELKSEEARMTSEEMFVLALQDELQCQQPSPKNSMAQIIAGLGSEPSRIPTTAMLGMCFKHGLFPALVVPLVVSEDDVVNTLLDRWAVSLPAPRRKLALMRKKEVGVEGEGDVDPEDETEEEEPIDLETAREEESTRLHEQFAEDQQALDDAIAGLRSRGVRVCNPVDASGASRQTAKHARRILDGFMVGRETLLEHCEVLDMASEGTIQRLLASGELLVGKHGLTCPVTGRTDSWSAISAKAVVYRDQLYFPRSSEARRAFMACPSRYLDKASLSPRHQLTCCVAGAPLSGKTNVALELANALGLVYVSPENAVEWVMQCQGGSTLRNRLQDITNQQQTPYSDPTTIHDAICTRLRSSECQTRGWVLDGYLLHRHELQLSLPRCGSTSAQSIRPDMLFILERKFQSAWKEHCTHVDRNELRVAFSRWCQHRVELLDVWTRHFGSFHVRQLDSSSNSLWFAAAQARAFLKEQQQLAAHHTRAMSSDRASRSLGVVRTYEELLERQHNVFQTFCPVELHAGRFYSSRHTNRDLCVDFRGRSFWFASEQNLEQFVNSPEAFVGYLPDQTPLEMGEESWPTQEEAESEAQTLVDKTPVNASLVSLLTVADCDFPEMKGYCPVTFAMGSGAKDWASLRHGRVFFRASYRSKVFMFVSEEARRKFCAEPTRYASQSLPVKLPPQVTLAKSYPGQMEQQLGAALNEVLLALGSERPKFPEMSMRASACVFLALSLKALQHKYQLKVKPDPRSARDDEDEPDEEQKLRQQEREEQAEQDAIAQRDAFVRDCRLGERLKAASTPAHAPCGSGAQVVRSMRTAQDSQVDDKTENNLPAPDNDEVEELCHRFDVIVSGTSNTNKVLSANPVEARTHARAAFLEYTKPSTAS